eukprot:2285652-Amphidinium_carterae.1
MRTDRFERKFLYLPCLFFFPIQEVSFEEPEYTGQADGTGTLRILEAIRTVGLHTTTRFYQAGNRALGLGD